MVEPVGGLMPHPQVARVRKVDRKPTSRDEETNDESPAERGEKRLSQSRLVRQKGAVCDILL